MAPTRSDGRTTELAEPESIDMTEAGTSRLDDGAQPFGDWREQLRERVKEIRARKLAGRREDDDLDKIANAATAEKLAQARAEVARGQEETHDPLSVLEMDEQEPVTAAAANAIDESVQLVNRERSARRAEIAGLVDDLLGPEPVAAEPDAIGDATADEPTALDDAPSTPDAAWSEDDMADEVAAAWAALEASAEAAAIPPPSARGIDTATARPADDEGDIVTDLAPTDSREHDDLGDAELSAPLFQEEPSFFVDDPMLEVEADLASSGADLLAGELQEPNLAPTPETQPVGETIDAPAHDAPIELDAPAFHAETGDTGKPAAGSYRSALLDQIPPELRDVEIPAWALPREPSLSRPDSASAPARAEFARAESRPDTDARASAQAEEQADLGRPERDGMDTYLVGEYTSVTSKRVDLGPPPETPVRTEDLLDRSIGELMEMDDSEIEIAPPGGLVDRATIHTVDRAETGAPAAPARPFPGLFDEEGSEEPPFVNERAEADSGAADPLDAEMARPDHAAVDLDGELTPAAATQVTEREQGSDGPGSAELLPEPDFPPSRATPGAETAPAALLDLEGVVEDEENASRSDLEWDADPDPAVIADARRQHDDPTAPVSDRVVSAVADGLVLLTIGLVLMIAGAAAGAPVIPFVQAAPLPFLGAWLLFGLVYGVMFIGTCGQTLGKMAMRVRVIGADSFHVGYRTAALRALAYTAAALPVGLGLLPTINDPQHRGLHDRLTGTRVVKA